MPEIYLIGDTHFGHKLIARVRGFSSIEEHDEALIENWNSVVKKRDTVWHLGDVAFGKQNLEKVARLNGTKKLVLGNHDQYQMSEYMKYFSKIFGIVRYKENVFSHAPVHPNELIYRWKFNVHGHSHNKEYLPDDDRYFCVTADHIDLTPIRLSDI